MAHRTLSVIMPNYNHSQYLPRSLDAIVTQSRPPDELIVLDDASTDNSVEIIKQYAALHSFVRLVVHERNGGVMSSVRDLLALATGDFVYPVSADDYVLPGFFEEAMRLTEVYPQAALVQGKTVVVNEKDDEQQVVGVAAWCEPRFASSQEYLRDCLQSTPNWHFMTGATIYHRQKLAEQGDFRENLGPCADAFALMATGLKYGVCYTPQRCAAYRSLDTGFAGTQARNTERMLQIAENVATLMRSPEFRERFPEDFVAGWRSNLERWIFDCYVLSLRRRYGASTIGLWRGRLLKQYLNLKVKLAYGDDLVRYMRQHPATP